MARLGSLAVLLALALVGCADTGTTTGTASSSTGEAKAASWRRDTVDPAVDRYLDRELPRGPGITVAAARGNRLVHCAGRGFADRKQKIPAGCDTVFDTMSVTKQFTAAAVMKLQMTGRLHTSDRISTYVPHVPRDKRHITIHQLLTHTSGLPESVGDDYAPVSRTELLKSAMAAPLHAAPGKKFRYSNTGYSVLAAIIEKASDLSYERYLSRYLFRPAGMTRTGYVLPPWDRKRVAVEYDRQGRPQGRPMDHPWAPDGPHWNLRGNGGMLSTARDMFRWHRALRDHTVLSQAATRKLFTPYVRTPEPGESYGYGWVITASDEGEVAWHDGGNGWSLATAAEFRSSSTMVFWVSNHAYRQGKWNLEDNQLPLTTGIATHLQGRPRPTGHRGTRTRPRTASTAEMPEPTP